MDFINIGIGFKNCSHTRLCKIMHSYIGSLHFYTTNYRCCKYYVSNRRKTDNEQLHKLELARYLCESFARYYLHYETPTQALYANRHFVGEIIFHSERCLRKGCSFDLLKIMGPFSLPTLLFLCSSLFNFFSSMYSSQQHPSYIAAQVGH